MTSPRLSNHRVVVTRRGGPEVLEVIEEGLPQPAPGEVRVRVEAAHGLLERGGYAGKVVLTTSP